jgi:hypothetical protein
MNMRKATFLKFNCVHSCKRNHYKNYSIFRQNKTLHVKYHTVHIVPAMTGPKKSLFMMSSIKSSPVADPARTSPPVVDPVRTSLPVADPVGTS